VGLSWSADSVCLLVRQMKAMIFYLILASKLSLGVKLRVTSVVHRTKGLEISNLVLK
jgi:hypothetical protein